MSIINKVEQEKEPKHIETIIPTKKQPEIIRQFGIEASLTRLNI